MRRTSAPAPTIVSRMLQIASTEVPEARRPNAPVPQPRDARRTRRENAATRTSRSLRGPLEAIHHVVAEHRKRTGRYRVEQVEHRQQPRMPRDPRLRAARRHEDANAATLREPEPRRERARDVRGAVIANNELASADSCTHITTFRAPKYFAAPAVRHLDDPFA